MALLHDVADISRQVTESSARSEKSRLLAECLRHFRPGEIHPGVAMLSGEIRQGRIGIGYATIRSISIAHAAPSPQLTVLDVDRTFETLAAVSGSGSRDERLRLLRDLLERGTRLEQQFLKRLLLGELRQGALEGVMIEAVAQAARVPVDAVRRALMLTGDLGRVAEIALTAGLGGLERSTLTLFRPLQPMLAQPGGDIADALDRLCRAVFEWKLDGARIQVHRDRDEIRVYSRRLNEVTSAVPEVVEAARALPAQQIVLDGEAIALREDGSPHPFQDTMRRFGRRTDVDALQREIPLSTFFFDCLHIDGEDLIDQPAERRLQALSQIAPAPQMTPRLITSDAEQADAFLQQALQRGHEGVMAKATDSPYEAGRRGSSWLKVKPTHTLDLVVLAVEWGSGRRRGWLSNIHLGARNPADNSFVMLGKTFKGMTDEMLAWQTQKFQELEIARDDWTVHVRPELVVEVTFDGVQKSSHYPGGLALRFARVKRYRSDKSAADADTIDRVRTIFAAQHGGTAEEESGGPTLFEL